MRFRFDVAVRLWAVAVVAALVAVGCSSSDDGASSDTGDSGDATTTTESLPSCSDAMFAVATDIDNTITASNTEVANQVQDVAYDQVEKEGALELMNAYSGLGYEIIYITARPETLTFTGSDESAHDVTLAWLEDHGFPIAEGEAMLYLAPDNETAGSPAAYKAGVVDDLEAQGYEFVAGYGDSDTDFEAFIDAGIPVVYSIGDEAGYEGTTAITGDTYAEHIAEVEALEPVCQR